MRDVADRVGVSITTVSLVLNGNTDSSRVSPETCRRVLDAAKDLHYSPNARARALRTGYTNVIGLYAGHGYVSVRLPFYSEIISGLQDGCEEVKKDLILHGIFHGTAPEDVYTELSDGRIDGLIVTMRPNHPLAKRFADSHLPVVAVADSLPEIPSVVVDDAEGSRLLAHHLFDRGHKRLAYVTGPAHPVSAIRRRNSFLEVASGLRMSVEERSLTAGMDAETAFLREVQSRAPAARPSAIACWNDTTAFQMLAACRRLGLAVPEEVAIVGFDGCTTQYGELWPLTTIHAPWAEVARLAVLHLDTLVKGGNVPLETILPVQLVVGQTT